jgi:hypothetical protein
MMALVQKRKLRLKQKRVFLLNLSALLFGGSNAVNYCFIFLQKIATHL